MISLDTTQLYNLLGEYTEERDHFSKKIEIINQNIPKFMSEVNKFIETNPQIKELIGEVQENGENVESVYIEDEYNSDEINNTIDQVTDQVEQQSHLPVLVDIDIKKSNENIDELRDRKIKNIYRKIVKLTHPDKTFDEFLHEFYIKATIYYNEKDLLSLFYLCYKLQINFTVDNLEIEELNFKISDFKNKNKFLDSNLTLVWFYSHEKEKVILSYIISQITSRRMRDFFI
jgi:hypothetical protein